MTKTNNLPYRESEKPEYNVIFLQLEDLQLPVVHLAFHPTRSLFSIKEKGNILFLLKQLPVIMSKG